jgi:hypothetical protein
MVVDECVVEWAMQHELIPACMRVDCLKGKCSVEDYNSMFRSAARNEEHRGAKSAGHMFQR